MDIIYLVSKPFSLVSFIFLAGVTSVGLPTLAWWQLVKAILNFHVDLLRKVVVWAIAFVALPARILTTLQRERTIDVDHVQLEVHLHEMETQLENLFWENKELEERLQRAITERNVIETVLEEIEEEHEKALSRIDLLENELQDLKEENLSLNEVQGKAPWDYKARDDKVGSVHEGIPLGSSYGVPSWSTCYKGRGMILQDILMHGDSWGDGDKGKTQEQSLLRASPTLYPYPPQMVVHEALARRRVVALSRSLFSAILSLLVGMIIWEAEGPCMPLLAALFTVVGMSLSSVVQFFLTIKNKPASVAVALLSVNWFILGTLTSPILPSVARMLVPWAIRLADRLVIWLGFSL